MCVKHCLECISSLTLTNTIPVSGLTYDYTVATLIDMAQTYYIAPSVCPYATTSVVGLLLMCVCVCVCVCADDSERGDVCVVVGGEDGSNEQIQSQRSDT